MSTSVEDRFAKWREPDGFAKPAHERLQAEIDQSMARGAEMAKAMDAFLKAILEPKR